MKSLKIITTICLLLLLLIGVCVVSNSCYSQEITVKQGYSSYTVWPKSESIFYIYSTDELKANGESPIQTLPTKTPIMFCAYYIWNSESRNYEIILQTPEKFIRPNIYTLYSTYNYENYSDTPRKQND